MDYSLIAVAREPRGVVPPSKARAAGLRYIPIGKANLLHLGLY